MIIPQPGYQTNPIISREIVDLSYTLEHSSVLLRVFVDSAAVSLIEPGKQFLRLSELTVKLSVFTKPFILYFACIGVFAMY